jgi:biotin carboxyl carrier protein
VKRFKISVNDKTYDVEVGDVHASPITVRVDGEEFAVAVEREATPVEIPATDPSVSAAPSPAPVTAVPTVTAGAGEVIAPMPGTVMDIAVKVGDVVKHGQQLCNLEAMKMKSPIRSTSAGKVTAVRVSEGQSAGYGDVLFVLEAGD